MYSVCRIFTRKYICFFEILTQFLPELTLHVALIPLSEQMSKYRYVMDESPCLICILLFFPASFSFYIFYLNLCIITCVWGGVCVCRGQGLTLASSSAVLHLVHVCEQVCVHANVCEQACVHANMCVNRYMCMWRPRFNTIIFLCCSSPCSDRCSHIQKSGWPATPGIPYSVSPVLRSHHT